MSALAGLNDHIADFDAAGARILAVSPDSQAQNRKVVQDLGLAYAILSDADLALTRALGLVHEGGGVPPDFADVPRPAVFILKDGTIRWRALTDNWRIRERPELLLAELRRVAGG